MVGSPSNLLYCTVPIRPPPPLWCGVVWCCLALFPSAPHPPAVVWCGVVVPAARPLLQQQRHQRHHHHIVNNWYPLKPAVLRGSVTPLLWCGAAGPPLPPPLWCGVVVPAARPLLQQQRGRGAARTLGGEGAVRHVVLGGGGGYHWGGGGVGEPGTGIIYIYIYRERERERYR